MYVCQRQRLLLGRGLRSPTTTPFLSVEVFAPQVSIAAAAAAAAHTRGASRVGHPNEWMTFLPMYWREGQSQRSWMISRLCGFSGVEELSKTISIRSNADLEIYKNQHSQSFLECRVSFAYEDTVYE